MRFDIQQQQLQKHFVIAHGVRQRQAALVRRLILQLQINTQLVRGERVGIQSRAELMQKSREDK